MATVTIGPASANRQFVFLGNFYRVQDRYPQVARLTVDLTWTAEGYPTIHRTITLDAHSPAFFKQLCGCASCHDNGFDLTEQIHSVLVTRRPAAQGVLLCSGWKPAQPCTARLTYRITATYR